MHAKLSPIEFINHLWESENNYEYLYSGKGIVDTDFQLQGTDSHLISVLQGGGLECTINGKSIFAFSESMMWVPPGVSFSLKRHVSFPKTSQLWFRFKVKKNGLPLYIDTDHVMSAISLPAQRLSNELLPNRSLSSNFWEEQRQKSVISGMISHLFDENSTTKSHDGLFPNQIKAAISFIDEHLIKRFYIDDLAQHLKLNTNYLRVRFKNSFGMCLQSFIKKRRIEKSAELLIKDQFHVYEVSRMMGYDCEILFSRQFKEVMGLAPSHWLSQNKEINQAQ